MKTEALTYALIAGAVALLGWLLVGIRTSVELDVVVGVGAVLALVATAALEYRISLKRLFGK